MTKDDVDAVVEEMFDMCYDALADVKENGLGFDLIAAFTKKFAEIEVEDNL